MKSLFEGKKVIDISYTVIPGEDIDRPFAIQRAILADRTFRYDILKTHSHVGTHVEVASHFYGTKAKSITDYPLTTFYGPGVLFSVKEKVITADVCEKGLGTKIQNNDIVVIRNETGIDITKEDLYDETREKVPRLTPEAAHWLVKKGVKMIIFDFIFLGKDIQDTRDFHDILMRKDVVFVEFLANLDKITKERFDVMALPYKVKGLDSSFVRAVIIEDI